MGRQMTVAPDTDLGLPSYSKAKFWPPRTNPRNYETHHIKISETDNPHTIKVVVCDDKDLKVRDIFYVGLGVRIIDRMFNKILGPPKKKFKLQLYEPQKKKKFKLKPYYG